MGWTLLGAGLLLALYTLLRHGLRRSPPLRARPELRGRTAIVTGGSSGIGAATALELARCGARVVLATRNAPRGEAAARRIRTETGNAEVLFMQLDLASLRSVRAFATAFLRQEPHLHLLINNAGVSAGGTTEDGFSLPFQVNHLGHFLLTQLLLERLQSCAPSRVVIVASRAHCAGRLRPDTLGRPPSGLLSTFQDYCDSKLANVLHARELATRLQGTQVTCYAVHPAEPAPAWALPRREPGCATAASPRPRVRQHGALPPHAALAEAALPATGLALLPRRGRRRPDLPPLRHAGGPRAFQRTLLRRLPSAGTVAAGPR
ncbi:dehydrogenase/reductase SDR family member 13 isoform X2 [Aquila chrysaetos chrysaetos]|uniref:dehydrogenase/reductase SDR family member 13 isoform X2 n=1 Tax=Aquila chrysaetos chrysaetos TaxID=223781 RepID=UPI0011770576|nr:dehydrogenase/reductase SDR family member 13 isoform X2 [Aquila chrysaetos chrysaetos]